LFYFVCFLDYPWFSSSLGWFFHLRCCVALHFLFLVSFVCK
jgi:hypothetical protein